MKSNICKIEKGNKDLEAIFKESKKVAEYNGLTHKQALQLRLLCEEIDGMLPNIIDDFEGTLWIDFEDGICNVNVSIQMPKFDVDKKEELINLAKNKKNASAVGILGRIRSVVEDFFLDEDTLRACAVSSGSFNVSGGMDYSSYWSLTQYKENVKKENDEAAWDELEKSVISSVADDVIVGVKGKQVDIVIVKKFA
jgi:hypothetical protein